MCPAAAANLEDLKVHEEFPAERELALWLLKFPDVIQLVLQDLHIHRLAEYLYDVATRVHEFLRDCWVVGPSLAVL